MIAIEPYICALIFDCDGTLVDSMPAHIRAWERAFADFGEPSPRIFLDPLKGMIEEDIVELYNGTHQRALPPDDLVARKHDYFRESAAGIQAIEPVVEVVRRYRGRLPMAVVSGGRRENVDLTLESIGIGDAFTAVLTADDPFPPKPAPDLFLEAARRLDISPDRCLVFEDGDLGLEAARAAGMETIDVRPLIL